VQCILSAITVSFSQLAYRFNEDIQIAHPPIYVVLSNPSALSDITVQVGDIMATAIGELVDFVKQNIYKAIIF